MHMSEKQTIFIMNPGAEDINNLLLLIHYPYYFLIYTVF